VRALLSAARSGATPRRIPPPKPPVLLRMAAACPGDRAGVRDRALLLLAAAGLGRAALVGLDAEDLRFMPDAVDLIVRQGPGRRGGAGGHGDAAGLGSADTDGEAHGRGGADRLVIVARGINRNLCAVQALRDWLETSDTLFGPVFRKIDRWGNIEQTRLGTDAIRRILTRRRSRKLRRLPTALP
jgi:site-specific recombinase XerC